jgi:hypothetical protein
VTGEVVTQLWQLGPEIVTTVVAQIEQESGSLGEAMAAVRTLQAAFPIAAPLAVRDPNALDGSRTVFLGVDLAWADGAKVRTRPDSSCSTRTARS